MEEDQEWESGLEEETEPPGEHEPDEQNIASVIINASQEEGDEEDGLELVSQDFVWAFVELAQRIASHPNITHHTREVDFPTPDFTIQTVEDGLGGELAPELKSLYKHSDLFRLEWFIQEDGARMLGGAIHLASFMRVFGRWLDTLWIEQPDMSEQEKDFVWTLRGFDIPSAPGTLWGVLSVNDEDPSQYSVWTRHPDGHVLPMRLGLIDYLYCALGACGAPGWQLVFTDYDFAENPWDMPQPEEWLQRLESYFPESDTDFFREHLAVKNAFFEEE
jgi:hypothetical protein